MSITYVVNGTVGRKARLVDVIVDVRVVSITFYVMHLLALEMWVTSGTY
jgi:hypothetical protein